MQHHLRNATSSSGNYRRSTGYNRYVATIIITIRLITSRNRSKHIQSTEGSRKESGKIILLKRNALFNYKLIVKGSVVLCTRRAKTLRKSGDIFAWHATTFLAEHARFVVESNGSIIESAIRPSGSLECSDASLYIREAASGRSMAHLQT